MVQIGAHSRRPGQDGQPTEGTGDAAESSAETRAPESASTPDQAGLGRADQSCCVGQDLRRWPAPLGRPVWPGPGSPPRPRARRLARPARSARQDRSRFGRRRARSGRQVRPHRPAPHGRPGHRRPTPRLRPRARRDRACRSARPRRARQDRSGPRTPELPARPRCSPRRQPRAQAGPIRPCGAPYPVTAPGSLTRGARPADGARSSTFTKRAERPEDADPAGARPIR